MKRFQLPALAALALLVSGPLFAQEAVVGAKDPEALFTSKDPVEHRNKQTTYRIMRDLLEANHWEMADQLLTERYLQHNPNAPSGRQSVVDFFTKVLGVKPSPIPAKIQKTKIVSVVADGDLVTVAIVRELTHPKDPNKKYTTTWFDMWRFVDGKADEHWDGATLSP